MKKIIFIYTICSLLFGICDAQWLPDFRLTNNSGYSLNSSLASNVNFIHAVWQDDRDTNNEIYYKRSTDEGASWGSDTRLTNNSGFSQLPSVSVSGSAVHVVWEDSRDGNLEIYYKRSNDNGATWGADTRLTNNPTASGYAHISVSGSSVHVVWRDNGSSPLELFYKRSTDGGITWSADVQLTTHTVGLTTHNSISSNGSNIHIAWSDSRDGNYEIYYKRSTDGGVTWGADTRLTNNAPVSEVPSITTSATDVHIAWVDNAIFYKHSTNNGTTWSSDTNLASIISGAPNPSIFLSGSIVHLSYGNGSGNYEIYYNRSTNNGISWGTNMQLSSSLSVARDPHITATGSSAHLIWTDTRNGSTNHEIYYKRNPTGNTIGIINISTEIPNGFSLSQNYPNPFNPNTKIQFSIPVGTGRDLPVQIKAYDVLGNEVAVLVNENLNAGTYEVDFDGSKFSSGIYFYKLIASDFTQTKKMVLIK